MFNVRSYFIIYLVTKNYQQLESAKLSLRKFCQDIKSKSDIQTLYKKETRELFASKPITFSIRGLSTLVGDPMVPCDKPIWDTWMSQWHLPSLTVALELRLFDLIAESEEEGLSVSQLSHMLALSSDRGLKALLQALVASDYLERISRGVYMCTTLSRTFLSNSATPEFYWGEMLGGADGAAERHRQLIDTIKNDDIIGAAEEWETGELTLERAEELTQAFHSHSLPSAQGAAKLFPLANTKHLLDIGGGSGCYSAAFVEANRQLQATVMDLPPVCKVTKKKYFDKLSNDIVGEYEERLHTLPKDMFKDKWPEPTDGFDAIFFSNILHDWSMETCRELLEKSFRSLPSGGELLLHEMLLDSDEITPACFSVHMAVYTRGQQFFFDELKDMAEDAGFVDVRNSPTHGYYSIISAKKP